MENKKELPLSIVIEETKKGYINAINEINKKYTVPAFLAELILIGILSDIKEQKNIELSSDYNLFMKEENYNHSDQKHNNEEED